MIVGHRYRVIELVSASGARNRNVEGTLVKVVEAGKKLTVEEVFKYYGPNAPSQAFAPCKVKRFILQRLTNYRIYPETANFKWEAL